MQRLRLPIFVALAAAALASAPARAADDRGVIEYRQSVMAAIGANMGALSAMMKYGLPYLENAAVHARGLEQGAGLIPLAFGEHVSEGPTDAKTDVWSDPEGFRKATEDFRAEAATLAEIAESGDRTAIAAQVKALGKACGGCHDSFRKPKEESYKRSQ